MTTFENDDMDGGLHPFSAGLPESPFVTDDTVSELHCGTVPPL